MIRPQYHFRDSPKGLLAWDVRRLVKLSEHLPVRHIRVSAIAELDENHWYSYGNVAPTCRSMDGMHRVCKAILEGEEELPAVQFEADPEPDYVDCDPDSLPYDA